MRKKEKGMRKIIALFAVLILMVACVEQTAAEESEEVIAKIKDKKITISNFNKIIGYFDSERQKMIEKNPHLKETILRQLVQSTVIADLAKNQGFDKKPEIIEQLDFFKDNFLANEFLKRQVAEKVTIPEEDMKAYYDDNQEEFKTPEMVRVRHILVRVEPSASEEDKKKAKEKAEDILKKIKEGEDFAELASGLSDDPGSKANGGDLGFISRGRTVKPFEDAAFALKPGEVSGVVETQFGFHIIKVEERKEAGTQSYENAKERIRQKLSQDRSRTAVTEFIDKAMKEAEVELHPELLMKK
ncbi:MAG: peptidylprolyl isomerase [Nitrospirota bacterium]